MFGFDTQDFALIITWTIVTLCSYMLLRKIKSPIGKTEMFDQYTISLFNALVIVLLGYDIVLFNDYTFFDQNTEQEIIVLCITLGHIIQDTIMVCINMKQAIVENDPRQIFAGVLFLFHHILVTAFIIYVVKISYGATFICYLLVIYDISTIFFSLRGMMRDIGLKDHPLTSAFEITFGFSFTVFRIGWGSFIIAYLIFEESDKCPLPLKLMLIAFQFLNYFWFYGLIKIALFKTQKS